MRATAGPSDQPNPHHSKAYALLMGEDVSPNVSPLSRADGDWVRKKGSQLPSKMAPDPERVAREVEAELASRGRSRSIRLQPEEPRRRVEAPRRADAERVPRDQSRTGREHRTEPRPDQGRPRAGSARPSESRPVHHHMRGLGPETNFNVYDGDAVVLPPANAIPYASNLPRGQAAGPGLLRSISNKVKEFGQRVSSRSRSRQRSNAGDFVSVPGGLRVDRRIYTEGVPAVQGAIPVEQAQAQQLERQQSQRGESSRRGRDEQPKKDRYPFAFNRQAKKVQEQEAAAQAAHRAQQPRMVKVVGHPDRGTMWGDFVNADRDDSARTAPNDFAPVQQTQIRSRPPTIPNDSKPVHPSTVKRRSVDKRPVDRRPNVDKSLPPVPIDSAYSAMVHADGTVDPAPDDAWIPADDAWIPNAEFGQMPMYADEALGAVTDQLDQMNLDPERRERLAGEIRRLDRKVMDHPPPGAMGVDASDFEPETIIDQFPHDKHTSWRMTDTSEPNIIHSYYTKVENNQHIQRQQSREASRPPVPVVHDGYYEHNGSEQEVVDKGKAPEGREGDVATALWERLDQEKMGKAPARRSSGRSRSRAPPGSVGSVHPVTGAVHPAFRESAPRQTEEREEC
jgi:hypothetical protein